MPMTPEAIQNDESLGLPLLNVSKIYLDADFNCRGAFSAIDCVELARDIARRGLQQPVTVKPLNDLDPTEKRLLDQGLEYKMIAGHRRLMSYRINQRDLIPAIIKAKDMSAFEAKDLNAIENLQRKELNLQQECNAIRHYWFAQWSREDVSERVGKSPGWVQVRYMLLEMPQQIQDAAGQGYITTQDVRELYKYRRNAVEQLKMAGIIRDKRKAGERGVTNHIRKKDKPNTKKHRGRAQIFEVMYQLQDVFKQRKDCTVASGALITDGGNNLATAALAWCAGEISTFEFYINVDSYCKVLGIPYTMPEMSSELDL